MQSVVALIRCNSYDPKEVEQAVRRGISLLGGIETFLHPGEKILLKPNLLSGHEPQKCVTTHPAVFEAAARVCKEAGAVLSYGDSPGYGKPRAAAQKSGIAEAAVRAGIAEADFETFRTAEFPDAKFHKSFPLASGALDADGIISLPKMKTHSLTRLTGAVKNQFGCVFGFEKAKFHLKYPNTEKFCSLLIDLNLFLKPRLYIMDGIMAMEGEGPAGGEPVKMNVLLFSSDPIALDATFCRLVGLEPSYVPTNPLGESFGLGTMKEENIQLAGDEFALFYKKDFRVKRKPVEADITFRVLKPLRNQLVPRPVIDPAVCVRCGVCVEACPVPGKALRFKGSVKKDPPNYDYKECIRCYCCHEMCPHKAIHVETPLLGRILTNILGKR